MTLSSGTGSVAPHLDDLDRRVVAALQADGRAPWAKIGRIVGSTETTVSRRAQRLLDTGALRVVGVADPIRCGFGHPVLVQMRCETGAPRRVAEALSQRDYVRFCALATGRWDVIAELIVPSQAQLSAILIDDIGQLDGVHDTATSLVTRNFKTSYDWSRALLGRHAPPAASSDSSPAGAETVDLSADDLALLAAVADNGRRSVADLATELNVTEPAVRRRLTRLVDSGCLLFSTLVLPAVLGFDVELFVWLRVRLDRLGEAAAMLGAHPSVRYISATTGFADLVCEVVLSEQAELYTFTTEVLGDVPGLVDVEIGVELENRKRAYRPSPRPALLSARGSGPQE